MPDRLTVAAAQIACAAGDIAANLARHVREIDAARERGVDLLVFPELSLTDYLSSPDLAALARPLDGGDVAALVARAGPMLVSIGLIEAAAEGCFNTQVLLDGTGVRAVHRKLNLPTYGRLTEGDFYQRGDTVRPVPIDGWSVATLICADTWNPALPWLAALRGSELLLVPIASSRTAVGDFDNPAGWEVNLRHTALTYGLPIVMANHVGRRGGLDFWGGSRVLDASGRELARAGEGEETIVAQVALRDVVRARARLPTVRDADPLLVRAELDRVLRGA